MKNLLTLLLLSVFLVTSAQEHKPLMPYPQKIQYGKNKLLIKGLSIEFTSKPAEEDIFAAQELASFLLKSTSIIVPFREKPVKREASIIFERTGDVDPLPVPGEKAGPSCRESYTITVTSSSARISSPSSAGLYYGVQTLRQMIEGNGDKSYLPEVIIEDWPSLAYRGFMMDMSHTQLPKIEEIKRQIDFLAMWKSNQYLFYSEASIELDGYPLLMADARFTKSQVREVIDYAKERHIDVIPNMELYGHLHDLFRLEHYSHLAVIPHGGEFIPNDPGIKPLLDDWISQISRLFPSPFFHIGFDETWLLETGAKKLNKAPGELYLEMLGHTNEIVEKQGKIPLVWADMLQKYPTIITSVSKKVIAVPWHYFPLSEARYDQLLSPFSQAGIDIIVQSALINWNWLVPDFEISFQNTDLLIRAGRKYNAIGFINSGWTDDTQTLMRLGFPDIAYGSAASWQTSPVDRENFFRNYTMVQYPPSLAGEVEKAHKSMMESEALLRKALGETITLFWMNPFTSKNLKLIESNKEDLRKGRLASEDAQTFIRNAMFYGIDTSTLFTMLVGAKMLDYLALKYLYAGEINDFWKQVNENPNKKEGLRMIYYELTHKYHSRTSDLMDAIVELKDIFQKAWLEEYTTFRLGVGLGKYDAEFQFWWKLQLRLKELSRNYNEGDPLPTLESLVN